MLLLDWIFVLFEVLFDLLFDVGLYEIWELYIFGNMLVIIYIVRRLELVISEVKIEWFFCSIWVWIVEF